MSALKKIPFFLFLLPVFFCLHGWLENYGFIDIDEILLLAGVIAFSLGLLFLLIFFISKRNYVFAALVTFFIGLWYLFFGAIVDWLKGTGFLFFLSSYKWLFTLLLLATVGWILIFRKKTARQFKWMYFLNVLLLIYCLIDAVMLIGKATGNRQQATRERIKIDPALVKQKPNIYLLVFDEYAGYKSLVDSFGYHNDDFYNGLRQKQFQDLPVFANYDFTLFSMSSILNLEYVAPGYDKYGIEQRDLQLRANEIRNAAVVDLFKELGYGFRNYSIFDIHAQHGISRKNSFLPVHSVLLTDKILHNRVMRTSGWLFQTGKFAMPDMRTKYLLQHDQNNQAVTNGILQTAREKKSKPLFSYGHYMMPHWPFYKDSTGKYLPDSIYGDEHRAGDKGLYLSYLKHTNHFIHSLADSIIMADPSSVIIIMSDHGFRSYADRGDQPYVFDNMALIRQPGGAHAQLSSRWSNVNMFRYVLNTVFDQRIPYLGDSSIVLKYK